MKDSQPLKKGFYIKVNKKELFKDEKSSESESLIKKQIQTNELNIAKSNYLSETKNTNSEIKNLYSPNKQIKILKDNKINDKSIKKINRFNTYK